MCVRQIQSLTVRVINAVSLLFAKVGLVILVAMMILTVAEVLLRYVFNRPILGSTEVIKFMMVTLAFLVLVWCTMRRGHVKVEVVARHFPLKVQAICDTIFSLFSIALYSSMAWHSLIEARDVLRRGKASDILDVPEYPFYLIVAIASGVMSLLLLNYLVESMAKVVKR